MDSNWQGGDPNRRGAYYNPEQRHDHPSSPSRRRPPNRRGAYYNPEQRHDLPSSSLRRLSPDRRGRRPYYNPEQRHDLPSSSPDRRGRRPYYNPEQRHDLPSSSSRRWSPNRRGPYYNPEQRHDHPSSSSRRWRPQLLEGMPLQLFTSFPMYQQRGGFIFNPSSSRVLIPTDGNISGNDFAPMAVPMPGDPGYHYSDSVAPRPSMPNVIGSQDQYLPHSGSAAVFPAREYSPVYPPGAGVYAQQRGSATVFNAPGYDSNPHASVYQPGAPLYAQPGDATDFSARGGNVNNDPYTSAGLIPPPANATQGASHGPVAGAPNRSYEANALQLQGAVESARMPDDFEAIIDRVIWDQRHNGVPLMEVAASWTGERALMDLVRSAAVNLQPEALQRLFGCLVDGWIMDQKNGPFLLQYFFTTLGYVRCSIFIEELALRRFWAMVTSSVGHLSMRTCLENARYTEQGATLQDTIVINTVEIARNMFGSILLRSVLRRGLNDQLMEHITERVEDNVMELSMNLCGHNVVLECFLPRTPSVLLLRRGLRAFLRLRGEELRELVQNHRASYVLSQLLRTSVHHAVASEAATQLAERILGVWAAGARRRDGYAEANRPAGDRREQAIAILQEPVVDYLLR